MYMKNVNFLKLKCIYDEKESFEISWNLNLTRVASADSLDLSMSQSKEGAFFKFLSGQHSLFYGHIGWSESRPGLE